MRIGDPLGRMGGGLMAAAFASAVGWLIASEGPSHACPPATWPYWLCGGIFAVGALMFAGAQGWLNGLFRHLHYGTSHSAGVTFVNPRIDDERLSLVVVNTGVPAEFKAQVLDFTDERGRRLRSKTPWTVPWDEPGASPILRIVTRERGVLDFARFDWAALDEAIETTKWGNAYHWFFSSTG